MEHAGHARHIACIKTTDVKAGERGAVVKHAVHIRYIARIETADVKTCKLFAATKHFTHVRYITCIINLATKYFLKL